MFLTTLLFSCNADTLSFEFSILHTRSIKSSNFIPRGLKVWVSMSSHRLKPRNCSGTTFQSAMMTHPNCFLSANMFFERPETKSQSTVIVQHFFGMWCDILVSATAVYNCKFKHCKQTFYHGWIDRLRYTSEWIHVCCQQQNCPAKPEHKTIRCKFTWQKDVRPHKSKHSMKLIATFNISTARCYKIKIHKFGFIFVLYQTCWFQNLEPNCTP